MNTIVKVGLFFLCINLSYSQNQNFSNEESLKKLIKRVNLNRTLAAEAKDYILNDQVYVFKLWKPYKYNDSINWDMDPYNNKSWKLYFQSLRMLGFLAEDYKYTRDHRNLIKTKDIINSWYVHNELSFNSDPSNLSSDVWSDHAVANRVLNLLHVYFTYPNEINLQNRIKELLSFHCKWLYAESNYTGGNHAVMIDRALLQTSQLFDFKESLLWQKRASERLDSIFKIEVTDEGVCTENSPGYHFYVLDLLIEIVDLYNNYQLKYNSDWDTKISKMKQFAEIIIKPNMTLPVIGDTYYSDYGVNLFKKYGDSSFIDYSGEIKTKKIDKFRFNESFSVFPKSGYFVYKERTSKISEALPKTEKTYLSFINTNLSRVHKHNDFMSITLSSNDEDLITDSGHLGYEQNEITNFVRSTFAHSGITFNNKNLNFKELRPEDVTIEDYEIGHNYALVKSCVKVGQFELSRDIVIVSLILLTIVLSVILYNVRSTRYRFQELIGIQYANGVYIKSGSSKIIQWQSAIEANSNITIGNGIGDANGAIISSNFENNLIKSANLKYNAHNQYIQTFVGLGVIGVIALLYLLLYSVLKILKSTKYNLGTTHFIIAYIAYLLMVFMTESYLERHHGIMFISFILCLFNYSPKNLDSK